jgi:glycerol uptake facilitator-like aquaporin
MTASQLPLFKRVICEALGTALLVAAVVGSGIMGEQLAGGNNAIALLANTIATGAALAALILTFGPLSGAHLNPVVTLAAALRRIFAWRDVPPYITAQILGGLLGTVLSHVMFGFPWYSLSQHTRSGWPQLFSEFVATFGLLLVIWSCTKNHSIPVTAMAVAGYITAAYWFTASTSFANPAVTLARSITDTFSGIRPVDVPGFIGAQLSGAAAATLFGSWLE